MRVSSSITLSTFAIVALLMTGAEAGALRGVTKDEYLDLVEAAVAAYSDEHIREYIDEVERGGVQEHGFPRLTANLGGIVAAGRQREKIGLLRKMMDLSCREAKKGPMDHIGGGNEFSVKELVGAILDIERAGIFSKDVTDGWRRDISEVNAWRCYRAKPKIGNQKRSYNWAIFGTASEQTRLHAGMGGDPKFVEKYVSDQMRWFDENGQWRDPHEPLVYDFVTRLQYAQVLASGYDGPSRAALLEHFERGVEATLALQSAAGEIPYGGRSNQFLHNDTFYAALCEWYAARFRERGDLMTAARFRAAAARAVAGLRRWLAERPVRHVKNLYATGSGKPGTGIGCEDYAYFDKYMATMGSWAMMAMRFADYRPLPEAKDEDIVAFASSPHFHIVALRAGEYSAQFDYNADTHYDCDGLGRIHRRGAPTAICLSVPCAKKPAYHTERQNKRDLAIAPVGGGKLVPAGCGRDKDGAWANWRQGALDWRCRLSKDGFTSELIGDGDVAMSLPAFEFDGKAKTKITCEGNTLVIRYRGWRCSYKTDGEIIDTGACCCNRNGRYRAFEARGRHRLFVSVTIERDKPNTCLCGEAPERANDFFWENDRVGFRAYGPGDPHKWSGIDVFNKATAENFVVHLLREPKKHGNWHKNVKGLGMDDYAVGPGRGVGGVAFRKDGKWLPDYGDWVAYRILTNCEKRCSFELDYRLPFGGTMTLGIVLEKGRSLFSEVITLSKDVPTEGLEVGVGLDLNEKREHVGELFIDEKKCIVSLFEKPHNRKGEEGSMMNAIFALPGFSEVSLADEPNGAKMIMTKPLKKEDGGTSVLAVCAGADWTEAGRFRDAKSWHDYVRGEHAKLEKSASDFSKCISKPKTIEFKKKGKSK